jgi:hypothetical protein
MHPILSFIAVAIVASCYAALRKALRPPEGRRIQPGCVKRSPPAISLGNHEPLVPPKSLFQVGPDRVLHSP